MAKLHSLGLGPVAMSHLYTTNHYFDFFTDALDVEYSAFADAGGSAALSSASGQGVLKLLTGETANTGVTARTPGNMWPWFGPRDMWMAGRFQLVDFSSTKTNFYFGAGVSAGKDFLDDDGGGPAGGDTGVGLYKVQDDPYLWAYSESYEGAVLKTRTSAKVGRSYNDRTEYFFTLACRHEIKNDRVRITYFMDPLGFGQLELLQDEFNRNITHYIDIVQNRSLGMLASLKNGDTTEQRLDLDWWSVSYTRGQSIDPE